MSTILGTILMIGNVLYRVAVDYLSNIIVGTILFPIRTVEKGLNNIQLLLSQPLKV